MRRFRLGYALLLIPPLSIFVAYVVVKGLAYWRNPALLGESPAAILLNLVPVGFMLFGTYLILKRLMALSRRGVDLEESRLSPHDQSTHLGSREDALGAIAAGAGRKPFLAVAVATFFVSMPVLMVALANGGRLAAAPSRMLIMLVIIELLIASIVIMVWIRVQRSKQQSTVNRLRE